MFEVSVGILDVSEELGKFDEVSDIGWGKDDLKPGVGGVSCEWGVEGGVELGECSEEELTSEKPRLVDMITEAAQRDIKVKWTCKAQFLENSSKLNRLQ